MCNRANGCSTTFTHAIACMRGSRPLCATCVRLSTRFTSLTVKRACDLSHRHMINYVHFRISLCNIALSIENILYIIYSRICINKSDTIGKFEFAISLKFLWVKKYCFTIVALIS